MLKLYGIEFYYDLWIKTADNRIDVRLAPQHIAKKKPLPPLLSASASKLALFRIRDPG